MPGVQHRGPFAAEIDAIALIEGTPCDRKTRGIVGPGILAEPHIGVSRRERWSAGRVIAMAVGHDHGVEPRARRRELLVERRQVPQIADAGVDQGRRSVKADD